MMLTDLQRTKNNPKGTEVRENWERLLNEYKSSNSVTSPLLTRFRQLIRVGGYHTIRGTVWKTFLQLSETKERFNFDYEENAAIIRSRLQTHGLTENSCDENVRKINALIFVTSNSDQKDEEEEESKWLKNVRQIMLDIDRTFPNHKMFIGDTKEKITLFRVLMMYSKFNTSVGYCQGMAYVAALLIMNMENEEDVFWSVVALFENEKYLKGFYDCKLSRMQSCAVIFELMLKDRNSKLSQHLVSLSIHPLMYITAWFMCLFTTLPCWDTVLLLCDVFFLEGYKTLFRGALAIMDVCSAELLAMDQLEQILPFIQKLPFRLASQRVLLPVFWTVTVDTSDLKHYTSIASSTTATATFKTPQRRRVKKAPAVVSTPVTRSFLSRIKTALTPISSVTLSNSTIGSSNSPKLLLPRRGNIVSEVATPSKRVISGGGGGGGGENHDLGSSSVARSGRKRKRGENSDPLSLSGDLEMKEMSQMTKKPRPLQLSPPQQGSTSRLSIPRSFEFSPTEVGQNLVCETPSSKLGSSPLTLSNSPSRRSSRIAQRNNRKSSSRMTPTTSFSLQSPGECPLLYQCDSAERVAFQTFSTATPISAHR